MEYVMTMTPKPVMVLLTGCRPKYVYKDGKPTDEQDVGDGSVFKEGLPLWRVELLVINENGSEQVVATAAGAVPFDVPARADDPSAVRFLGRTYGQGSRNITLNLARGSFKPLG